jgi:ParB family chromosome partitioning protein
MSERTKRAPLGRGLSALFGEAGSRPPPATVTGTSGGPRRIPVEAIRPSALQPRRNFSEPELDELAQSIRDKGILQPLLVRPAADSAHEPSFELVAGERRWRAAQIAGLEKIPALVRPRGDAEALELALIENMAREDLNPIEEARACAALVEELGLTREDVGRRVGRGRVAVSNLIRLLDLPDEVIELLEGGTLSEGHGRALLLAEDHGARRSLARSAAAEGWSVRVVEGRARESNAAAGEAKGGADGRTKAARGPHPDQVQAAQELAEALGGALGADVRVKPIRAGGYRAEIEFSTPEEALELARRLHPRAVA